ARAARGGIANWLRLQRDDGAYDPELVDLLERELRGDTGDASNQVVRLDDLRPATVLLEDGRANSGSVSLAAGHALSAEQVDRSKRMTAFVSAGSSSTARMRSRRTGAPVAGRGASTRTPTLAVAANSSRNVVPWPSADWTLTRPPSRSTTPKTVAKPRPVPP